MSTPVELGTELLGKTVIVQAFERAGLDPGELGDMMRFVGVLAAYGIGPKATALYFEGVNAPFMVPKDNYVEFYVPERSDADR